MSEEQANNPATELADPPAEPVEQTAEQTETTTVEPEVEEVEIDGERYSLPKKLKDGFLRQADYTRKTQELSEQRKSFEQKVAETIAQEKQRLDQERAIVSASGELAAVREQLRKFETITPEQWQQAAQQDPAGTQQVWMQYQALKDRGGRLHHEVSQAEQRKAFEAQQSMAKRIEQAVEQVRAEIPDWTPEKQRAIDSYAVSLGATQDELGTIAKHANPAWIIKALHKANLYDQVQKQAVAPTPPPAAAPIRTLSGAAKAAENPAKMSDSEWMAWREKELRKRRA